MGSVETYDDASPFDPNRQWKATGGGGTDFRPVFRYVDEHPELDPALLIYFTDGCGDCPERPPAYPVMWLLTKDGREQPWGQSVHFKNPCGGGDAPVSRRGLSIEKDTVAGRAPTALVKCEDTDGSCGGGG